MSETDLAAYKMEIAEKREKAEQLKSEADAMQAIVDEREGKKPKMSKEKVEETVPEASGDMPEKPRGEKVNVKKQASQATGGFMGAPASLTQRKVV
jgi:hypothetical protein